MNGMSTASNPLVKRNKVPSPPPLSPQFTCSQSKSQLVRVSTTDYVLTWCCCAAILYWCVQLPIVPVIISLPPNTAQQYTTGEQQQQRSRMSTVNVSGWQCLSHIENFTMDGNYHSDIEAPLPNESFSLTTRSPQGCLIN